MCKLGWGFFLILSIIFLFAVQTYADQFTIGLATHFDWWSVEKREWAHRPPPFKSTPLEWSADLLEEGYSSLGLMFGPEFSYSCGNFSLKGRLLFGGTREFDVTLHASTIDTLVEPYDFSGESKRTYMAIDLLYGKLFSGVLGYRRLEVRVSQWESGQFKDHNISDVVIGLDIARRVKKPGWSTGFQGVFGVTGLFSMFNKERLVEHPQVGEAEAYVGYIFRSVSIEIQLGYGVAVFNDLDRAYQLSYPSPIKKFWEQFSNVSHGAALNLVWLW
ncbi:MAG: hypothetical protein A2145_00950 [candidate division Zixibacteria bacterium RBG_16_40_9]|nr:MAG: hypothetical protein A2145_00950 [candidate division Zixibacteria bacterium RBG_16_40_9]